MISANACGINSHIMDANIFFFQAEDGIRDGTVTGVQTCALPICPPRNRHHLGLPLVCRRERNRYWRRVRRSSMDLQIRRSEERRVGKECRSRWSPYDEKKKKKE